MKIKAVCEATGLTDRAVRYYIEEGLLDPAYSENYLGRRAFNFSEEDVKELSEIVTLRKYGFSVSEIGNMKKQPELIGETLRALITRKKEDADNEKALIASLESVKAEDHADISSLVSALSVPVTPVPDNDAKPSGLKRALRSIHRIILMILPFLPLICGLISLNASFRFCQFPVIDDLFIILALLSLLPSAALRILTLIKKRSRAKRIACIVLSVQVLISIPMVSILAFGIVSHSETRDPSHYLEHDERVALHTGNDLYGFFPTDTHFYEVINGERTETGSYLYRNLPAWNYAYDIYAEWPDTEEELEREITRVNAFFQSKADSGSWWKQTVAERGEYECVILYSGAEPFTKSEDSYTYFIFAYDRSSLRVRYILCDSFEPSDEFQPYYLELDW